MEKLLIIDQSHYREALKEIWGFVKSETQQVVDAYNAMGIGQLKNEDFKAMFLDTENLIFDRITGGQVAFGGVPVDRKKALELIEKPQNYQLFLDALDKYEKDAADPNKWTGGSVGSFGHQAARSIVFRMSDIDNYFDINDKTGKVIYSPAHQLHLDEFGKIYAETEEAINTYLFFQDVVDAYQKRDLEKFNPICNTKRVLGFNGAETIIGLLKNISGIDMDGKINVLIGAYDRRITKFHVKR